MDSPAGPCGSRMMGDTTAVFVLSALQLYQLTGDTARLASLLEPVRAALSWQVSERSSH
jgi:hypothetical protein